MDERTKAHSIEYLWEVLKHVSRRSKKCGIDVVVMVTLEISNKAREEIHENTSSCSTFRESKVHLCSVLEDDRSM